MLPVISKRNGFNKSALEYFDLYLFGLQCHTWLTSVLKSENNCSSLVHVPVPTFTSERLVSPFQFWVWEIFFDRECFIYIMNNCDTEWLFPKRLGCTFDVVRLKRKLVHVFVTVAVVSIIHRMFARSRLQWNLAEIYKEMCLPLKYLTHRAEIFSKWAMPWLKSVQDKKKLRDIIVVAAFCWIAVAWDSACPQWR